MQNFEDVLCGGSPNSANLHFKLYAPLPRERSPFASRALRRRRDRECHLSEWSPLLQCGGEVPVILPFFWYGPPSAPSSNKSAGFGITHDSWIVKRMSISGATHVNDDDVWPPFLKQRYGSVCPWATPLLCCEAMCNRETQVILGSK